MYGSATAWRNAVDQGPGEVYVVDDDPAALDALCVVLRLEGFQVRGFKDAASFLLAARERTPNAIVLDVILGTQSGLDVLRELNSTGKYPAPVLMISGHGTIPMAVEAIRCGAYDFISKPFEADRVVETLRELAFVPPATPSTATPATAKLTPREREVLDEIIKGASSKETGRRLGISPRTVEVHRARIMDKLGARNTADLVRIVLERETVNGLGDAGKTQSHPTAIAG